MRNVDLRERFFDDLRADAGGIAESDGERRYAPRLPVAGCWFVVLLCEGALPSNLITTNQQLATADARECVSLPVLRA
jgi:hypothetical protein